MRSQLTPEQNRLHLKALDLSDRHRAVEAELCACLREIDRTRLYKSLGRRSLFQYAIRDLRLVESVAYALIAVARKSVEIPELKCAIETHSLSVSKASRVVSVLTPENAAELIAFAQTHTSREIDQDRARRKPQARKHDRIKPVSSEDFEVRAHISKATHAKLERAQALLAQKGKSTEIESVLNAALEEFLNHHDPVRKAERAQARKARRAAQCAVPRAVHDKTISLTPEGLLRQDSAKELRPNRANRNKDQRKESQNRSDARIPLSAEIKHAVFLRDQGRCTHVDENGERCGTDRWIDIHHIKLVSLGGTNELSNLATLCSFHHDLVHQLSFPIEGQVNWLRAPRMTYQA